MEGVERSESGGTQDRVELSELELEEMILLWVEGEQSRRKFYPVNFFQGN